MIENARRSGQRVVAEMDLKKETYDERSEEQKYGNGETGTYGKLKTSLMPRKQGMLL